MPTHHPSMQSIYNKEMPSSPPSLHATSSATVAPAEDSGAYHKCQKIWTPAREYARMKIADLRVGHAAATFTGRIVNSSCSFKNAARRPFLLGACYFLLVKDETGAIAVTFQSTGTGDNRIRIGVRVTVWTAFVADYGTSLAGYIPYVNLKTVIHLGPASASHIEFHDQDGEPTPGVSSDQKENSLISTVTGSITAQSCNQVPELMTLRAFLAGGHEKSGECARVLVCVRSIGPRKTVRPQNKPPAELVEVRVMDETEDDCTLVMWGRGNIDSARAWVPYTTVLMLTNPTCVGGGRVGTKKGPTGGRKEIGIGFATMVEVDPVYPQAAWLRRMAQGFTRRDSTSVPLPRGLWDDAWATVQSSRTLYNIADVDERVRLDPATPFTGKLNVIVLEASLMECVSQGKLCCLDCCGVPTFSNRHTATCKHCIKQLELTLNPRVIGVMADETGCITQGKLVWSDTAWTRLLFPDWGIADGTGDNESLEKYAVDGNDSQGIGQADSWRCLTSLGNESLKSIQDTLLYTRLTLTFGWSAKVGRLSVISVEW